MSDNDTTRRGAVWQSNAGVPPALEAAMLDQAAEFRLVVDENDQPVWVSESVRVVLGYEPNEFLNLPVWALVHPDDLDALKELFAAALGDPGATKGPIDLRLLRGDGEWITVEALFTDYPSDPIVRPTPTTGGPMSTPVSPGTSPSNRRLCSGSDGGGLFDAADVVRVRSELARWDGVSPLVTERRTRTGPDARELRMTMSCPDDSESSTGIVGALEDVTDRRAVDEMLVGVAALGSVAGVVGSAAHDLHNLLASIGMQLGLLDRDIGENGRVRAAREAIDRACTITEDLMSMSRPSRGRVEPLEIGPLVADLTTMLRVLVDHQADLTLEDRSGALTAAADRSGLERIVTNLVVNARDAVEPRGRIRVEVASVHLDEDDAPARGRAGPHVTISVIDNGCGIPAAFTDRVFEPHFTTKEDGNGIGLAASRRNVQAWGGDLRFTTHEGRGTTFTVLLSAI